MRKQPSRLRVIRPRAVDTCHPLMVRYILSLTNGNRHMTAADVRRIALSAEGYGNLMLTLEQQAAFVEEAREIFLPIPGGWGKMGHTHIRLAAASEDVLTGALRTAWKTANGEERKDKRKKNHV